MKKIITFIMSLVGLLFISSCGNEETYSLKDISKSEVSNISTIMASTSAFQSASWPLSDTSYSYLDTKYIKTDFNIEEEFMKYPPKEDQDDAYIMHVDFNDSATHIFYISHKTNYMYYKGIEYTYRSLDIVPKELIDIINDKPKINTFDATIIVDYGFHREDHVSFLLGGATIPGIVYEKYSLPIVAYDSVHVTYIGEWLTQTTYPETIITGNSTVLNVSVKHKDFIEVKVFKNSGEMEVEPLDSNIIVNTLNTHYSINSDGTFDDINNFTEETNLYAIYDNGTIHALYSYNPYE